MRPLRRSASAWPFLRAEPLLLLLKTRAGVTWTLTQCKSHLFIYLFQIAAWRTGQAKDRFAEYEWNISRIHVSVLLLNLTCMLTLCTVVFRQHTLAWNVLRFSFCPTGRFTTHSLLLSHRLAILCLLIYSFVYGQVCITSAEWLSFLWVILHDIKHVFSCIKSIQEACVRHGRKKMLRVLQNMLFSNTTSCACKNFFAICGSFFKIFPTGNIFYFIYFLFSICKLSRLMATHQVIDSSVINQATQELPCCLLRLINLIDF